MKLLGELSRGLDGELEVSPVRIERSDGHLIQRERAGLVHAKHGGGPERLDGGNAAREETAQPVSTRQPVQHGHDHAEEHACDREPLDDATGLLLQRRLFRRDRLQRFPDLS